jgi:hypothetical protein
MDSYLTRIDSASDAYAGVQLYAVLNWLRKNLKPVPPLPFHAELGRPIRVADVVIPTAGELPEVNEPDSSENKTSSLSDPCLHSLGDTIRVEPASGMGKGQPLQNSKKKPPSPKDTRVEEADTWAENYRVSQPKNRAQLAHLRSYHIWHNNAGLGPENVAALLRDPPLHVKTVVNYILQAVRLEKLPFDPVRMKSELFGHLAEEDILVRFKVLVKHCESAIASLAASTG